MNSADAVIDVVAPPARTAPARAPAAASADEPSFEDHLEAATNEDALADAAPASSAERAPSCETESEELLGGPESAPVAAPALAAEQTAAPVVIQLIAAATPPATQTETQAAPPPSETAPIAPASTPAAPANETAPPMQTAPSAGNAAETAPADPAPEQSAAPSPQKSAPHDQSAAQHPPTPQVTPVATAQAAATVAPVVAPTAAAVAATPVIEGAVAAPSSTTPAQTQTALDAARHAKTALARGDTKIEAPAMPEQTQAAQAQAPASRSNAKPATLQAAAQDTPLVQTLDAPETAQPQTQTNSTAPAAQTKHAQHADADQTAVRALPAAHQVAREIVRRFGGGDTRFELRLDPPELGRVDVRLDVSRDHRVTAVISADSPQALTDLARHARELEQMLQSAGLELGDNGLSFDLRQHAANEAPDFGEAGLNEGAPGEETTPLAARPLGYERWRGVRVDMMV